MTDAQGNVLLDESGAPLYQTEKTVVNNTAISELTGVALPTEEDAAGLVAYDLSENGWVVAEEVEQDTLHQDLTIEVVAVKKTFTVTFYREADENGNRTIYREYTVEYGDSVTAPSGYTKNFTYANAGNDDDETAVTLTSYSFKKWVNDADSTAISAKSVIENVTENLSYTASFSSKMNGTWFAVLNPGLTVPAGTSSQPVKNYTNKVAGEIDYFDAPGSNDLPYIYGSILKTPTIADFFYTIDGKQVALIDTFDASKEYIKWYVIKDEDDGIHIDGYRVNYPTITYVVDGDLENATTVYVTFDKQSADGNNMDADCDLDELVLDTTVAEAVEAQNGTFSGWMLSADGSEEDVITSIADFSENTVVYGYSSYTTTVRYLYAENDEEGNAVEASESVVFTGRLGTTFEEAVASPEIENYTADLAEIAAEELTIVAGNKVITVVYTENDKNIVKISYYLDEVGGATAAETVIATNYIGKTAGTETVASPAIHGYTPDVTEIALADYTIDEEAIDIDVVYTKNEHELVITYVDEDGNVVDTYSEALLYEDAYEIETPVIAGSTADTAVVEGTMDDEDIAVTVTYTKNIYTVTYQVNGTTYTTVTGVYGDSIAELLALNYAAAEGYTFSGWTTDFEGDSLISNLTISATLTRNAEVEADTEEIVENKTGEVVGDTDENASENVKKTAEVEADRDDVTTADAMDARLLICLLAASVIAMGTIVLKKRSSKNA